MSVSMPQNGKPGQLDTEENVLLFIHSMSIEEARDWLHSHGYGLEHTELMLKKKIARKVVLNKKR